MLSVSCPLPQICQNTVTQVSKNVVMTTKDENRKKQECLIDIGPCLKTTEHITSNDLPCDLPCAASLAGIQPVRPRAQRTSP